ncbi:class I SAM-dependent methyltransferase [Psychroserpens damuponensis]|uniref:class I SAM-dependent methyltransferase n=1 Tax=Psychroserpens damuponensis TaxID=943936 RepID=UPI00058F900F|nr:class I SAM-dependent methyltransferase [Psychroserpens damuponensis]
MKFLDKVLRQWRTSVATKYVRPNDKVLDVGCFDGYLFKALAHKPIQPSIGIDPLLQESQKNGAHQLLPGMFPDAVPTNETFDSIVMLAVLEHIPRAQQRQLNNNFLKVLNPSGRIIITVPSSLVDHILVVLTKLRLVDGMSVDEHYGFKVKEVFTLFAEQEFTLIKHKKFQLGLNNLFVFEKRS